MAHLVLGRKGGLPAVLQSRAVGGKIYLVPLHSVPWKVLILIVFWGLLRSPESWAMISSNVAPRSSIYDLYERLDSYHCLRRTFRLLKPQSYLDLRKAVFIPDGRECTAPEWLLRRTRAVERDRQSTWANVSLLAFQDDTLRLIGQEAAVSPLFPERSAFPTVDGGNLWLEAAFHNRGGQDFGLSFGLTPGWIGTLGAFQRLVGTFFVREGYVKLGYRKVEFTWGRTALQFGDAKHGTLLLSLGTKPLDVWKFTVRPFQLGFLGNVSFETWVSDQGKEHSVPNTLLWALAYGFQPTDWLEFGWIQLYQFGGRGRPSLNSSDLAKMLFYGGGATLDAKRDRRFGAHLNVWLFDYYAKAYTQWLFGSFAPSYLMGMYLPRVGNVGLRIEWVEIAPGAYASERWPQGLVNEKSPIGHPLGSDSLGVYFDIELPDIPPWDFTLTMNYESRNRNPVPNSFSESRMGIGGIVDYSWRRFQLRTRIQYARIQNPQYTAVPDRDRFGIYGQLKYLLF